MEEKDLKELNEESRARGVKRSSEKKSQARIEEAGKEANSRGHRDQNRTKFI
jgi:hypothetical protein